MDETPVGVSEYDYELPKELIAQEPMPNRSSSRLMVLRGSEISHHTFREFPSFLKSGDVLVVNNTLVRPAKLVGLKTTGGKVEALLLEEKGKGLWSCLLKGKVREGTLIHFGEYEATVVERSGGEAVLDFGSVDVNSIILSIGRTPLPPYIKKELKNPERYQTVYAAVEGSVAAPTAGLHFTEEMLREIANKGVSIVPITLHIGPSTFLPVRGGRESSACCYPEFFSVSEEAARTINSNLQRGGRLFVVGTTAVKALESAASNDGKVRAVQGESDLFIKPPYRFKMRIYGLLTNFHLPRSTLLMLVSAYAGREIVLAAYDVAIREGYRFYSLGDAMLLIRDPDV